MHGLVLHRGYLSGAIGRLTELHARYYAATAGFGVAFEATVARELAEFCARYDDTRDGLWLAVQGRRIEASIVIDAAQVNGAGAHLRWVDAQRYPKTFLLSFAGLDAARHLYEAGGFRLVHEAPGDRWGTTVTEQRYERLGVDLSPAA